MNNVIKYILNRDGLNGAVPDTLWCDALMMLEHDEIDEIYEILINILSHLPFPLLETT